MSSRAGELAAALALAVAGAAAGYALFTYWQPVSTGSMSTAHLIAPSDWRPQPSVEPEPASTPVRVANPFDAAEIFEFPAGTSEADAREAMASLLIERAVSRGVLGKR